MPRKVVVSAEEAAAKREAARIRQAKTRAEANAAKKLERLEADRARKAAARATENPEERQQRLDAERAKRAAETPAERQQRLDAVRARRAAAKAAETPEQRQERLAAERGKRATASVAETVEECQERLAAQRAQRDASRLAETLQQSQQRLEAERLRSTGKRASETVDEGNKRRKDDVARASTSRQATQEHLSQRRDEIVVDLEMEELVAQVNRDKRIGENRKTTRVLRGQTRICLAGFSYDPEIKYCELSQVKIGALSVICKYCKAKRFKGESAGLCCSGGKVDLTQLQPPPEPLRSLLTGNDADAVHYRKFIRKYNSCFQMTSFGCRSRIKESGFMPTFKIQGQVYHKIGSLLPPADMAPGFLQIYFMGDQELEVDRRIAAVSRSGSQLKRNIVLGLQRMLHEHNDLVHIFKTSLDEMKNSDKECTLTIRADKTPFGAHERTYNAPTVNEVAVVIVGNESCTSRDIVLKLKNGGLQRISETHRSYDALQYPLIFWQGEDNYHFMIPQVLPAGSKFKKVSSMKFYAHRFMIREGQTNFILLNGQLSGVLAVDAYAKIEGERLLYIKLNQSGLRAEQYVHLRDAVANDGLFGDIGKPVILPSSHIGSPRNMHEYAQDGMAYVRAFGRSDLFITFTCNPNWPEIKNELAQGQTSCDRHDIVARVFRQKLLKLIFVLTTGEIFGPSRAYLYSVEWQKRGLPHAHILLWLKEKLHPSEVDKCISAEIPDKDTDPELFEIVSKNMIHNPCGSINLASPCMKDNRCSKRFPKPFAVETKTGEDRFLSYRRRSKGDGGNSFMKKVKSWDVEIDNSWVVPYSPTLLKMFDAHINVEFCHSVKSIKYICKYVNKGSDMAVIEVNNGEKRDRDEVAEYQSGRYISSNEAFWRIFSFPIHDRYPAVQHLHVHLENGQRVYFKAGNATERAEQPPDTTLTAFFKLCQTDDFARTLLYGEVPQYYTFPKKKFLRRKKGQPVAGHPGILREDTLGRVYTVHPSNRECFNLRLLLTTIRGPTSFQFLRTVNGEECSTFSEACLKLGLLQDDRQWVITMQEASETKIAFQLRELFAVLLSSCALSNAASIWEKYKEDLSEDILREREISIPNYNLGFTQEIFNSCLILLEDKCLLMGGKTLQEYGLSAPDRPANDNFNSREFSRETNYNLNHLQHMLDSNIPKLTPDQKVAFNNVTAMIAEGNGGLMFLDAPGGTGKTFLINLILASIRVKGDIALAVASSGIAATLLDGGRTAHSGFKLPRDLEKLQDPLCNISKQSGQAKVLQHCKLIVWDECTMSHRKALEALNRTLQDLREKGKTMGGLTVLLSGDFRQTLPVLPRSTPADEIEACLKRSFLWTSVRRSVLSTNMRVRVLGDDTADTFSKQLLDLGNGSWPKIVPSNFVQFPTNFCTVVSSVSELVENVFPNLTVNFTNQQWLCERAILAPKNDIVNQMNEDILLHIPGQFVSFKSVNSIEEEQQSVLYPVEFLNSLNFPGLPLHEINLKIGSPIMLLRNLNPPKLCNGTRLTVQKIRANIIEAKILTGCGKGETVLIPRIPLLSNPNDLPFVFKRLQFPIKLAFAMTVNKSQGQSLKVAGVNLETPCFSHGQLYVACSRVGSPKNLFILAEKGETLNVVYPNVLD